MKNIEKQTKQFDKATAYVFSAIAGVILSFFLPPLILFVLSLICVTALEKFVVGNNIWKYLSTSFMITTLIMTLLVLLLIVTGGINGFVSTMFGNYRIELDNLPIHYLFIGMR